MANEVVMVMGEPIKEGNDFLGMVASVVTLERITSELADTSQRSGLEAYVVDNSGRLVTSNDPDKVAGMDMAAIPIVQKFLDWEGRARVAETTVFPLQKGNQHRHDARHLLFHPEIGLGGDRAAQDPRTPTKPSTKCAARPSSGDCSWSFSA